MSDAAIDLLTRVSMQNTKFILDDIILIWAFGILPDRIESTIFLLHFIVLLHVLKVGFDYSILTLYSELPISVELLHSFAIVFH